MPRLGKVTDSLSAEARQILADGVAKGRTAAFVAQAIADECGEEVAERTIGRRMAEMREAAEVRQSARERMADLVAALKAGSGDASDYIQALAMRALELEPDALTSSDPVKVQRLSLQGEGLKLKREQIEIRRAELELEKKRVGMLEDRERRLVAAVEDKSEALSPEERYRKVREILGLRGAA